MTGEVVALRPEKISALALSFPSLRSAPGVIPWEPLILYEWALPTSHGSRLAAAFVLSVWNTSTDWDKTARVVAKEDGHKPPRGRLERFDVFEALQVWDDDHRAVFLSWVGEPFFP